MSSVVFLLASVACASSVPTLPVYNQENAALAYNNPLQYTLGLKSFQDDWERFWNNLVNQHNAFMSQYSPWSVPPNGLAAPPPGFQGSWTYVQGFGPPNVAFGTAVQSGSNALAGTNLNEGVNSNAGANAQSGVNELSGINANLGIASTQTSYDQQASQATSGTNTNSGINIHQGTNTHQGISSGPSNYNGPLSGASSTVVAPNKQPVYIQGAMSNVGNAGSIYVPAN